MYFLQLVLPACSPNCYVLLLGVVLYQSVARFNQELGHLLLHDVDASLCLRLEMALDITRVPVRDHSR